MNNPNWKIHLPQEAGQRDGDDGEHESLEAPVGVRHPGVESKEGWGTNQPKK